MNDKQRELELWLTREELAKVNLELWQYRRLEAQQHVLRTADELKSLRGTEHANQSS